ncbi:MAG: LysR family transcriptional regulator [Alphaproteobacteria bacterium]|nr:LysR family transcriptional regulator [Alphaproteobacteria bacterium]
MQKLSHIPVFLEVAKQQSFAKAAKHLGMAGPAASKQVMALEEELGVKLLNRTTRLVTLTEEGLAFYERARVAMDELKDAAAQIQESKTSPKGILRINAPLSFGQMHLLPVLSGFAKKYPDVRLEVSLDDRMIDVVEAGYDVVIRVGVPQDSTLVSKHLAPCPILVVASQLYLAEHGWPRVPADLKNHRIIAYSYQGGTSEWKYKDAANRIHSFRSEGVLRANTSDMMLQAALDGVGIAMLPQFCVSTHIAAGTLIRLFPDHETYPERQITALMPPNRYRSAKVQLFLDWLTQSCKSMPL